MAGWPCWIDHACETAEGFDLAAFAACPCGSVGVTFDPGTLKEVERWSARANPAFSNETMPLKVGDDMWLDTFSGTRAGIIPTED